MSDNINSGRLRYEMKGSGKEPDAVGSTFVEILQQANVIDSNGDIAGEMRFLWVSPPKNLIGGLESFLYHRGTYTTDGSTQLTNANATYLSHNFVPAMFTQIRHVCDGVTVQTINNPAQDDTFIKRVSKSSQFLETAYYSDFWIQSATTRLDNLSSDSANSITSKTGDYTWHPYCLGLFNADQYIVGGHRHELIFTIDPAYEKRIFQAAADKTEGTNYKSDMVDFRLVLHYIEMPDNYKIPKEVYIPHLSVESQSQAVPAATSSELTFTVPYDIYKVGVALQHTTVSTDNTYSPTEFTAGSTENVKLTRLEVRHANKYYPPAGYTFSFTAGSVRQDVIAYKQYLVQSGAMLDTSGHEDLKKWVDLGRIFLFNIEKQAGDRSDQLTVKITASSAFTAGAVTLWVFPFTKRWFKFTQDENFYSTEVVRKLD